MIKVIALHTAIKIELQNVNNNLYVKIKPEILDYYIYGELLALLRNRITDKDRTGNGFEEVELTTSDIRGYVKTEELIAIGAGLDGEKYAIPVDYWVKIRERVYGTYSYCGKSKSGVFNVTVSTHNTITADLDSPFDRPKKNRVLRVAYNGFNELISAPDSTINKYTLVYLYVPKYPIHQIGNSGNSLFNIGNTITPTDYPLYFTEEVNVDDTVKIELIKNVVTALLEGLNSQRYQTVLNELRKHSF